MRLEGKADCKRGYTEKDKAFSDEAPHSDHAESDRKSGGVSYGKKNLAVCHEEADENQWQARAGFDCEVVCEDGRKREDDGNHGEP